MPDSAPLRRAAFIDRDGVINEDREFVYRPEDFVFLDGAVEGLRQLQAADYLLVVVTNQSGIARGLYSEADYQKLTHYMREQLLRAGVRLDRIEYCPHLPDAPLDRYRVECDCRKPRPGLLHRAITALGIDAGRSILIGDRASDIEAGRQAGIAHCFLVRSGKPLTERDERLADGVYRNLAACVEQLLT
jgi:D-glycero-D-manno-heptose 1,7-bisphosphate phosphatase